MASDDVQKNGEPCLREGKRCAPEDKKLSLSVTIFELNGKWMHYTENDQ